MVPVYGRINIKALITAACMRAHMRKAFSSALTYLTFRALTIIPAILSFRGASAELVNEGVDITDSGGADAEQQRRHHPLMTTEVRGILRG